MKFKQLYPKSVRPSATTSLSNGVNKHRVRCSLCDSLLKASNSHRYFLMGKSAQDNLDKDITYGECCQRYLTESCEFDRSQMICPRCCQNLQQVYSLHKNAEELIEKVRHSWTKTKRLNRTRHLRSNGNLPTSPFSTSTSNDTLPVIIKEEIEIEQTPPKEQESIPTSDSVLENIPYDLSSNQNKFSTSYTVRVTHQPMENNHEMATGLKPKARVQKSIPTPSKVVNHTPYKPRKSHLTSPYPSFVPMQTSRPRFSDENEHYHPRLYQPMANNQTGVAYAQLMIDSPPPSSSTSSNPQQTEVRRNSSSNSEQTPPVTGYDLSLDGDRSLSPRTNDDDTSSVNGSKNTRLSRRQYDFLIKLPDQQSLNTFIENSSAESGSRWTWRRTSANSRGYKVYYVCNFSMRRHYHPCPAAMYALFHPEGSISIYACGQHQHIPKDRLPVSITDATKDEIFKCLQAGMATTDIREHLTRSQLPFGDTRKLNNFIKYHKELLRFGTVTNVRIGGTAYRQPQCWAIRRQNGPMPPVPASANDANQDTNAS